MFFDQIEFENLKTESLAGLEGLLAFCSKRQKVWQTPEKFSLSSAVGESTKWSFKDLQLTRKKFFCHCELRCFQNLFGLELPLKHTLSPLSHFS